MKLQHKHHTADCTHLQIIALTNKYIYHHHPPHYIVLKEFEHRLQANNINADKMKTMMMIMIIIASDCVV